MKPQHLATLLVAACYCAAAPVQAADTDKLKAATCLNCHDVEKKKMGPAFKESAKKGVKGDELVAKMKEGKGHPKVAKPEAELKAAVEQALAIK